MWLTFHFARELSSLPHKLNGNSKFLYEKQTLMICFKEGKYRQRESTGAGNMKQSNGSFLCNKLIVQIIWDQDSFVKLKSTEH